MRSSVTFLAKKNLLNCCPEQFQTLHVHISHKVEGSEQTFVCVRPWGQGHRSNNCVPLTGFLLEI